MPETTWTERLNEGTTVDHLVDTAMSAVIEALKPEIDQIDMDEDHYDHCVNGTDIERSSYHSLERLVRDTIIVHLAQGKLSQSASLDSDLFAFLDELIEARCNNHPERYAHTDPNLSDELCREVSKNKAGTEIETLIAKTVNCTVQEILGSPDRRTQL